MAHTARHEVPVAYLTGSNGDVHLFLNEIDDAVVVLNLELEVRIPCGELGERRHQQVTTERHRDIHAQATLRALTCTFYGLIRLSQVREDAAGTLEVLRAISGERDPAGRPVEKPHAQMAL